MLGKEPIQAGGKRGLWWHAFAMSTLAFVSGLAAGGAATAIYFVSSGHWVPDGPQMDPLSVMEYLRNDLHVSPEQEDAIRAILREHHAEFMAFRRETMPRMQAQFNNLRDAIAAQLTPDQAELWRKQFEDSRRRSLPIRDMIWLADMNDDGLVDEKEFGSGFPDIDPGWFTKADTDKNGALDKAEVRNSEDEPELIGFGPP